MSDIYRRIAVHYGDSYKFTKGFKDSKQGGRMFMMLILGGQRLLTLVEIEINERIQENRVIIIDETASEMSVYHG
jgi:hypothetical protein